ncbi:MAG TPA: GNAT family N-acetyltransferase [Thermoanaerobaculia bacterium]|nr:GNAT family N-acetyltransferase [Thermoanaerobaculia bacterium]
MTNPATPNPQSSILNPQSRTRLRLAVAADEGWINAAYADVHFQLSDLSRELMVVAEVDGERAGIGRLVPLSDQACELGGILVFDQFRGRGIALAIVAELLRHAAGRTVYCVPFTDLEPIYARAGFVLCEEEPGRLPKLQEKLDWCRREIDRPVSLMVLSRIED